MQHFPRNIYIAEMPFRPENLFRFTAVRLALEFLPEVQSSREAKGHDGVSRLAQDFRSFRRCLKADRLGSALLFCSPCRRNPVIFPQNNWLRLPPLPTLPPPENEGFLPRLAVYHVGATVSVEKLPRFLLYRGSAPAAIPSRSDKFPRSDLNLMVEATAIGPSMQNPSRPPFFSYKTHLPPLPHFSLAIPRN